MHLPFLDGKENILESHDVESHCKALGEKSRKEIFLLTIAKY